MAGYFDSPWRIGSKVRGNRSPYKIPSEGLPFKRTYPVHLTDVMDQVPTVQTDLLRGELSPVRGTRSRAVRELEFENEELKKENFDLKMRRYLMEETLEKCLKKLNGGGSDDQATSVHIVVELQYEYELLKKEFSKKDQLFQEALAKSEKYSSDFNTLKVKFDELQEQLKYSTKIPEEAESVQSTDEKENFKKEVDYLQQVVAEKDLIIQNANDQIEELSKKIEILEGKVKKRSLALQGIVCKYHKDTEMIPKDLRPIVQMAVQAAKERNEEDLESAISELKASLGKIMPVASKGISTNQVQDENEDPNKTKSSTNVLQSLSGVSQLADVTQASRQPDSKTKFVSGQSDQSPIKSKYFNRSSESLKSLDSEESENFERMVHLLEDNDSLKADNEEKARTIQDLNSACSELERKNIQLMSQLGEAVSKAKLFETKSREEKITSKPSLPNKDSHIANAVQCDLLKSELSDSFLANVGKSDSPTVLKEEIYRLLLIIEQKERELSDFEQEYSSLQTHLGKLDVEKNNLDNDVDDYVARKDLENRLAQSNQINQELMDHLRKLEKFMEDLLQHRNLDSSSFEASQVSDVLSHVASYLNDTRRLSTVLSDHISVCENSKFDTSVKNDNDQQGVQSYSEDPSRLNLNSSDPQGMTNFFQSEPNKSTAGTGKRRLSFSTLHNSRIDTENVVVLGTSNNEDLILLLNDNGDPKDVLIRNNHTTQLDMSLGFYHHENSIQQSGCQSRLRCPSSDSDIWSEPDRDISMQRIGIDVQKSPVATKSPRRLRLREKLRATDGSKDDETSSCTPKLHPWSKRRRSGDALKSPICKKCLSSSKDELAEKKELSEKFKLQKVVDDLSSKCSRQENHLSEMNEIVDLKVNEIDELNREKQQLLSSIDSLKTNLKELKSREKDLTLKSTESNYKLSEVNNENAKLKNLINSLETKATESDSMCRRLQKELQETEHKLQNLDRKCSEYEVSLSSSAKSLEDYKEKFSSQMTEASETQTKIEKLISEKNKLLQAIQQEEAKIKNIESENEELRKQLEEKSQTLTVVQSQYSESDSMSRKLRKELEKTEQQLRNLDERCHGHETDLLSSNEQLKKTSQQSLAFKKNVMESLLKVKDLLLNNILALEDVCSENFSCENERFQDNNSHLFSKLSRDYIDKIEELFENVIAANDKLKQIIEFLSTQLHSVSSIKDKLQSGAKEIQSLEKQNSQLNAQIQALQQTSSGDKSVIKDSKSQIDNLNQELVSAHDEIKNLNFHWEQMKTCYEDIQQSLKDKEESLIKSKENISSSEAKAKLMQSEIELAQNKLAIKDEKISQLQGKNWKIRDELTKALEEKVLLASQIKVGSFEAQQNNTSMETQLNDKQSLLDTKDKQISHLQNTILWLEAQLNEASQDEMITKANFNSSHVSASDPSKGCQVKFETSPRRASSSLTNSCESIATSSSCGASVKEELGNDMDKYRKKIKSLKAKLVIAEKRIEILEKEKNTLREELLLQVKKTMASRSSEEVDSLRKELADLNEKLQAKSSFIVDLKSDMFKTCNSLVDKQKEVDSLKQKLSDSKEQCTEVKLRREDGPMFSFSEPQIDDTESNIKTLKKHKWELIQGILDQQKQFYELKNIHLGHLAKFKAHIEKLHSIQVSGTMSRSLSLDNKQCMKKFQTELELDVECLSNFNIFLKRFFIPLVLKSCDQCTKNMDSSPSQSPSKMAASALETASRDINISTNEPVSDNIRISSTEVARCAENTFNGRLISTASALAHKIDTMKTVLKSVKPLLENVKESSSFSETPKTATTSSSIGKLVFEMSNLQASTDEIFHLNSVLKSLIQNDVPLSPNQTRQDMSDRESLSEEIITLSRSGSLSPMSIEENPLHAFIANKSSQAAPTPNKSLPHPLAAGESLESILQRSHFSSPDLGIESDPNRESSAPEQGEKDIFRDSLNRLSRKHIVTLEGLSAEKQVPVLKESSLNLQGLEQTIAGGDTLHAISILKHYELLKKEVEESSVGIRSILSRTMDGLQHVSKYASPRKSLEHSTFRAIKETSENIAVCLEEARKLVGTFWIAPCPTVEKLNELIRQNQECQDELRKTKESMLKQERCFEEAMANIKQAEVLKEKMERKISRKLVRTKKVLRQAEMKLQQGNEDLLQFPKYPENEDPPACQNDF